MAVQFIYHTTKILQLKKKVNTKDSDTKTSKKTSKEEIKNSKELKQKIEEFKQKIDWKKAFEKWNVKPFEDFKWKAKPLEFFNKENFFKQEFWNIPENIIKPSDLTLMAYVPEGAFPFKGVSKKISHFYIRKYLVTQIEYCKFLNDGSHEKLPDDFFHFNNIHVDEQGNYFVNLASALFPVALTYFQAQEYIAWLNEKGPLYRLPTEEEWEKAASWDWSKNKKYVYGFGGDFGDFIDSGKCNYANYCEKYTEVGHFKNYTSPCGCYDMSGNIWEWTSTKFVENKYVIKGGGFLSGASSCQCEKVGFDSPDSFAGVRLVLPCE